MGDVELDGQHADPPAPRGVVRQAQQHLQLGRAQAVLLGLVPHLHPHRLPDALERRRELGVDIGGRSARQHQLVIR